MRERARLLQLVGDLRQEVIALDSIVEEARQCLISLANRAPTSLELRGVGDIVHDFYNAVEHYFERVALELNGGLPAGSDWHVTLLARMARELPDVRPAVIRAETRSRLDDYLRFRHLFRHRYGFELEWMKLVPLLTGIDTLAADLRGDLLAFIDAVSTLANHIAE